jgi:ATP-dependent helicase STH1/SNF2
MREMQQEMDSQERDRAAAPATVRADSSSTACAGAAGGSSNGHKGDTEGRIELLSLRLRSIQRRLRASVADAHPLSGLPGPGALRLIKREVGDVCAEDEESPEFWRVKKEEELRKRKIEAHARFLESVVSTHDSLRSHFKDRRELMKRLCKDIGKEFGKRERKKQALIDKEKKDRLLALKSNNFDAYRKQIQDSKNEKMKQMVKDMDRYMEKLGANINRQTAESAERVGKEMDQNAATEYTFHLPINEKITEQSSLVGGNNPALKLKTYQIEGVNWLINLYNNNMSGILADEMGLGKTIQVIGMICYLVEHKNNNGPYLVIAPLSTISNWQSEFEKWAPTLTTYVYKGSPAERKRLFEDNMKDGNFNVLIVQFELVMDAKDAKRLKSLDWSHIIVDEGHRLKNRESKLFGVLTGKTGYRAKNRVILSGTPLQNEIHELWSLLNFLLPEIFETSDDFEEWFAKPFRTADDGADYDVVDEEKEFLIKCLHAVLRPFMTRRLKADLKDTMELPETREATIWCRESARACVRASVRRQVREERGGCGADTWKRRETGWGGECFLTRRM